MKRLFLSVLALAVLCSLHWVISRIDNENVVFKEHRVFGILLHEGGHMIAAFCSGGRVHSVSLNTSNESGACATVNGWAFLICLSGYASVSLVAILLLLPYSSKFHRRVIDCLTLLMLVVCWHGDTAEAINRALLYAFLLCLIAMIPNQKLLRMLAFWIGSALFYFNIADIRSDTMRTELALLESDALSLSEDRGGSTVFWGYVWMAWHFILTCVWLRISYRRGLKGASAKSILK